jgi:transcriptional regulator with XRE-family HTH domain
MRCRILTLSNVNFMAGKPKGRALYPEQMARHAREVLRRERERLGLSQEEMGARLGGLNQSTIARYEAAPQGEQMQLAVLLEMRRAFRMSLDEILGLAPIAWSGLSREEIVERLDELRQLVLPSPDGRNAPPELKLLPPRKGS